MDGLLFVSQAMLDAWSEQGCVDLEGEMVVFRGPRGPRLALDPAVRFLSLAGGDGDPHALVGKVKRVAKLRELGAECLGDAVVLGEVAYAVQPGFLAESTGSGPGGGPQAGRAPAGAEDVKDLAELLLEKLA